MMICVAFIGGGGVLSVVSVLCGAGGGLTVQPVTTVTSADIAAMTRRGPGTVFRVSAGPRATHSATPRPDVPRRITAGCETGTSQIALGKR
jgi:hypothetical protein